MQTVMAGARGDLEYGPRSIETPPLGAESASIAVCHVPGAARYATEPTYSVTTRMTHTRSTKCQYMAVVETAV